LRLARKTVESETPQHFAGLEFSQTILSNKIPAGAYYEGLSCTHFRAYALCFKAEASTVESVRALVNLQGTLEIQKTEPGKHPSQLTPTRSIGEKSPYHK
jgi:hypothetical protein